MDVEQNMIAFETAMRWNGFKSPTRSSTGDGYTYARDADRFRGWELHRQSQELEIEYLQAIEAAARNLVKVKGHTMNETTQPAVAGTVEPTVRSSPAPTRTPHGFSFGAADVSANASDERGNVWLGIKGKRAKLTVHVTPSGLLRVWMNGMQVLTTK